jgi:hypothetical protein
MFSLEEYTHTPPGKGLMQLGLFIAAVFGLCGVVYQFYPDKPSYPREFPDGLEAELGGSRALRVCICILVLDELERCRADRPMLCDRQGRQEMNYRS